MVKKKQRAHLRCCVVVGDLEGEMYPRHQASKRDPACGTSLMLKWCRLHSQCVVKELDNLNVASGYSSAMTFHGKSKEPGPAKIPVSVSANDQERNLIQEELSGESTSVVFHRRDELTDSLRALPNRISHMEEQWRDMLGVVRGFTTHSDACMEELRLDLLNVKKLALRDNTSVRDMAREAKFQKVKQASGP